jgi:hypothetical protein
VCLGLNYHGAFSAEPLLADFSPTKTAPGPHPLSTNLGFRTLAGCWEKLGEVTSCSALNTLLEDGGFPVVLPAGGKLQRGEQAVENPFSAAR